MSAEVPQEAASGPHAGEQPRPGGSRSKRAQIGAQGRRRCVCGQPLRQNAEFCRDCERWARRRLADQGSYCVHLHVEHAKEARKQALNDGGRSAEQSLPYSPLAGVLIRAQLAWLAGWWQTVYDAVPPLPGPVCDSCGHPSCRTIAATWQPDGSVAGVAAYLAQHLPVLRRHPRGREFITSLRRLSQRIVACIDAPEHRTRFDVGPCPEQIPGDGGRPEPCPGKVRAYVPADESAPAVMRCSACHAEWPSRQWHAAGAQIVARAEQLKRQRQLARTITGGAA